MSDAGEALLQAGRGQELEICQAQEEEDLHGLLALTDMAMEREMLELHLNVESLLPDAASKIIQITGSRAGEGVSTVVRQYARMAALNLGKSVLIMHATGKVEGAPPCTSRYGWDDAARGRVGIDEAVSRIGGSRIYVTYLSPRSAGALLPSESSRVVSLFAALRERFDLVLIDSPPAAAGAGSVAFSRNADGVVLVVESEKTRWPIIENAKNRIAGNGGKILGIVFNKRKNYIPGFIYSRL